MALTNLTKTVATLVALAKTTATLVNLIKIAVRGFLLKEDGDYLLLETGYKIILDGPADTITNLAKTVA